MRNAPLASTDLADIQQSFADAYPVFRVSPAPSIAA
jgi:hypothetical protein